MAESIKALEALSTILNTGANAAICLIAYTVFKHELRINRLEGKAER
jgi:hypothetical protein